MSVLSLSHFIYLVYLHFLSITCKLWSTPKLSPQFCERNEIAFFDCLRLQQVEKAISDLCWWDWSYEVCNYPHPRLPPVVVSETRRQAHPGRRCSSSDANSACFVPFDSLVSWSPDWRHSQSVWVRCCNELTLYWLPHDDDDDERPLKATGL